MERYRARPTYVEAVQITDEMIDAPHPSPLHVEGVTYNSWARTASLEDGSIGGVGGWIVQRINGHLAILGNPLFTLMYEKG